MEPFSYRNSDPQQLDAVFSALADSTRRQILSRLALGDATVGELARPFAISQPAVSQHLKVLEKAGLIEREQDEQRRPARLKAETLVSAAEWIKAFEAFWNKSFDELDQILIEMKNDKSE